MLILVRIVVGVLLLGHGLVHLLYLASSDVPEFTLEHSWLVPDAARRPVGLVLMVATVVAFTLVALAVWGVPGLSAVWPVLTVAAGVLSAVLLVLFWSTNLVFGLVVDAALVVIAVLRPDWADRIVG